MLEKCHFEEYVMQSGVPLQGSNRGYKPIQLILGLFAGVWCGASCFGHLDVVRYDAALCDLLGWKRGADNRAYQRYLNKFSQAVNQRVFGNLFRWFFSELKFDNYTLDFDSTVMACKGSQEGAAKGYNPKTSWTTLASSDLSAWIVDSLQMKYSTIWKTKSYTTS